MRNIKEAQKVMQKFIDRVQSRCCKNGFKALSTTSINGVPTAEVKLGTSLGTCVSLKSVIFTNYSAEELKKLEDVVVETLNSMQKITKG